MSDLYSLTQAEIAEIISCIETLDMVALQQGKPKDMSQELWRQIEDYIYEGSNKRHALITKLRRLPS